uniref:Uncharacterized protein n=1 Tax=Arundo donax TaxID=35708 RepID=A0A0A8YQ84_ARUDO
MPMRFANRASSITQIQSNLSKEPNNMRK